MKNQQFHFPVIVIRRILKCKNNSIHETFIKIHQRVEKKVWMKEKIQDTQTQYYNVILTRVFNLKIKKSNKKSHLEWYISDTAKFNSLFQYFMFWSSFRFLIKLRGRYRDSPCCPRTHTCTASLPLSTSLAEWYICYNWHIIIIQNPEFTWVHCWWCTFYGFGPMFKDICTSL